ncbi:Crp/Fnr family transcriptional regulator [Dongia sp.]|uniref:Crp/Fnr family transcriptional regulator n=1 Tax=Dongia sp. TaxID=1977262 RepID=UPI0035B35C68
MIDPALLAAFAPLGRLDETAARRIAEAAQPVAAPAGTVLARPGDALPHFVLLTAGIVKVRGISEGGREIVLYRVAAGETCVLSAAALLGELSLGAELVAETDIAGFALPQGLFQELVATSQPFRQLIFSTLATRLQDIVALLEDVAFRRIDARLADYLLARKEAILSLTHQDIAAELGTAREVVSRQLKEFERRGWLKLTRGQIALGDRDALSQVAGGAP